MTEEEFRTLEQKIVDDDLEVKVITKEYIYEILSLPKEISERNQPKLQLLKYNNDEVRMMSKYKAAFTEKDPLFIELENALENGAKVISTFRS